MNYSIRIILVLVGLFSIQQVSIAEGDLKSDKQKAGYSIGVRMGGNLKPFAPDMDFDAFLKGLNDMYQGKKLQMSTAEIQTALQKMQTTLAARKMENDKQVAQKNSQSGKKFLAANKKKKGVITTKSGLQYKVIKSGTGATPKSSDTVTTHYRGTLIDGTEFDSSYNRGKPASFPVGGVIKGWTEALQLMKVGDKWELYIPAELAYGANGPSPKIGPNSTLIFEIELIKIGS